jgi:hypothetical protein
MTSPISLSQARQHRASVGQKSPAKVFDPRGAGGRPVRVIPVVDKAGFVAWWAGLLRRRCGDAATVAQTFGCTEQAARYWLDEFSCPMGQYVDLALALWPEDFIARHAPAVRRVA